MAFGYHQPAFTDDELLSLIIALEVSALEHRGAERMKFHVLAVRLCQERAAAKPGFIVAAQGCA